jgi:hypothetical protein
MKRTTIRKIFVFSSLLLIFLLAAYFYVYKGHRDIASEAPFETIAATDLIQNFQSDEKAAIVRFANQTIVIYGNVTDLDLENNSIMINDGVFVQMVALDKQLNVSDSIKIKGRLVGFDDLMGEIIIDQAKQISDEK